MGVAGSNMELSTVQGAGAPLGDYSSIARAGSANILIVSGQVPVDVNGETVGDGNMLAQAEQVLKNLEGALRAFGATRNDVCKLTTFVTAREHLAGWRDARRGFFEPPFPAATAVIVQGLAREDWLLEVEAVAVAPS